MLRTLFIVGSVVLLLLALPGAGLLALDILGRGGDANAWLESRLSVSHRVAIALPAAVAMFAVLPTIVLLYFLRLRRKPQAVSSTFLWQKSVEDMHVNRLLQWLRRNFLLLLQLFAVLMMIYGVLGPRLFGTVQGGRHYILLIDNSASMSATDVSPSRLEWAKAEALKEIDRYADGGDTGMVIAFSSTAEIRQSYTKSKAELKAAVRAIQPTERPTRIDEALALAASLANPLRTGDDVAASPVNPEPGKERTYVAAEGLNADLHIYSDGRYPPVPEFALANLAATYHPPRPTTPPNNVAVLRFDAERDAADPTTVVARATVRNSRTTPVDLAARVELLDAADAVTRAFDENRVRRRQPRPVVPAGAAVSDLTFTIPEVPLDADLVLRLSLDGLSDDLPIDDQAWVALGVTRRARVAVVGPENPPLRFALDSASGRKLAEVSYFPAGAVADAATFLTPAREGRYDLVIFDRCRPADVESLPRANTLYLGATPPGLEAAGDVTGVTVRGKSTDHPVLRNLQALDEIEVVRSLRLPELPPRTERLMEGLTDAVDNVVLMASLPRGTVTDVVVAFPLIQDERWNTNWPLKVSFPIFVRNVILALGNVRDSSTEPPVRPGEVKSLRLGTPTVARLTPPGGSPEPIERGSRPEFLIPQTDRVGVYRVSWDEPGQPDLARRFCVNLFDDLESDLSIPAEDELVIGRTTVASTGDRRQPLDLWRIPVALGLLALVAEWWVYNRRVQI